MFVNCPFVMVLLAAAALCSALDYSDLEAMGAACDGRDSCESPKMSRDFAQRNCECDRHCGSFGDCCVDSPFARRFRNGMRPCMPYGTRQGTGVYAIATCPTKWEGNSSACAAPDMGDPLVAAPVTLPNGATFANAHCALCNGVDLSRLVPWTPLVSCPTLASYNLSADFIWEGLRREGDRWGVTFQNQFHPCDVIFDKPDSVVNVRPCRAGAVSTCPAGYRREAVRRNCESYAGVVHTLDGSYLNAHCALCNGVDVNELFCDRDEIFTGRLKFSFALIFDVNPKDGDRVGIAQAVECPSGKKYDPFNKTCRNLVCAIPGYRLEGARCVKAEGSS